MKNLINPHFEPFYAKTDITVGRDRSEGGSEGLTARNNIFLFLKNKKCSVFFDEQKCGLSVPQDKCPNWTNFD